MPSYTLFNRDEYFDYIIAKCEQSGPNDTIIVATMEFRPDQKAIKDIVDAMCLAKDRGADITFVVDAYSFMLKEGAFLGPLFFNKREPKSGYGKFKHIVEAISKLRDHGVTYVITNKPTRALKNPFGGRSHIKYAIFNDEALIGGCNLSNRDQLDVMVKMVNKTLVDYLIQFTKDVIKVKNVRKVLERQDVHLTLDDETELVIDSGVKKQSLIYSRALDLIDRAIENVYMTCQYFPNTDTPAALARAAERGVGVHLAYNHPSHHPTPIRAVQNRTVAYKKKRLPLSVFENELHHKKNYLHAKILVSENEAIIGSHNFVGMGVNLGTAEIALHSTSKEFIDLARSWIKEL